MVSRNVIALARLLPGYLLLGWLCTPSAPAQEPNTQRRMCIVIGAAGEPQYGQAFREWGSRWSQSATDFEVTMIGGSTETPSQAERSHRESVLQWIAAADASQREHWLILLGHGTHDAKATRFNLQGPDLSAEELAKALEGQKGQWVVIVCASSSGPFLQSVSGSNRVVITATKSGSEENFSRFGDHLSHSLSDPSTDLDHDGELSVLELFLAASRRVEKYYSEQCLLATEQALIDDNGDARGTPAAFYRGVRAIKAPADGAMLDGARARRLLLAKTDGKPRSQESELRLQEIEGAIEELRKRKPEMDTDIYYQELEQLLLSLARELGRL